MTPRVLFLDAGLGMGGAEQSLLLLVEGLRAVGIEATVGLFGAGPFQTRLSTRGIPVAEVRVPRLLRRMGRYHPAAVLLSGPALTVATLIGARRIASLARRLRVDLIHSNGLKVHVMAGLAGRLIGMPVIWHLRDFPPPGVAGSVVRAAARRLPTLVVANSDIVAAAIANVVTGRPRVRRIYNAVDLDSFHPRVSGRRVRAELGLDETTPVVGMVAHLTPWKGHEEFLAIAREIAGTVPHARFVVAGGPIYETDGHRGYAAALRARAETLGLRDRVAFIGARDDVAEVLAAFDVLVHCPIAPEPFGRVIAEAMAIGRPVVAARGGGIPEVLEDGVTGILVAPRDVDGFASAVVRLLGDPGLCDKLGAAGRDRAEAMFTVEAHVSAVVDAYRTVMARGE